MFSPWFSARHDPRRILYRPVRRFDRHRRVYPHPHPSLPLYAAAPVHDLGRPCPGPAKGAAAVTLYVVLGLAGLPVFTAGGGPSYVFQPTFGYLLGFIAGAWIAGLLAGPHYPWTRRRVFAAVYVNLAVVYGFGVFYTYLISSCYLGNDTALWSLFLYAFAVEVPGDVAVCFAAAVLSRRLRRLQVFV